MTEELSNELVVYYRQMLITHGSVHGDSIRVILAFQDRTKCQLSYLSMAQA